MESVLHSTNIITHIVAGTFALIIGFIILIKKKGTLTHKRIGRWFLISMILVVLTGAVGVIIFNRNLFLLVLTTLVGYNTYSGIRIIRTKTNEPKMVDFSAMIFAVVTTLYFLYYLKTIGFYWNPVIIYSTVGYLFMVIAYDLLRYLIPISNYGNLWLYEHTCKMISALGGLLSAFVGTILPDYKPYSQFLPSAIMTIVMIIFVIMTRQKLKKNSKFMVRGGRNQ
ncbi:hypothetical protein [Epilithonimonas zeae]|uniref:hypothetical protein n=1 Tax=Epilithonimonas zeae TaxID=1416779 RepID=UPI00200E8A17|nr:hypothetical protein [Epilithonimonas zeae]UQB69325.1 hypothetical protein KI430_02520 [Epilithonimonas zeae]